MNFKEWAKILLSGGLVVSAIVGFALLFLVGKHQELGCCLLGGPIAILIGVMLVEEGE